MIVLTKTQEIQFWKRVIKDQYYSSICHSYCWKWTGIMLKTGYGRFFDVQNHKMFYSHRLAYEMLIGQIPNKLELDHICQNRSCCNPDHLDPVTKKENIDRINRKGRMHYLINGKAGILELQRTHCKKGHKVKLLQVDPNGKVRCFDCVKIRNVEDQTYGIKNKITVDEFLEKSIKSFGIGILKQSIRLILYNKGFDLYSPTVQNARKYLEKGFEITDISIFELADKLGLKEKKSKCRANQKQIKI